MQHSSAGAGRGFSQINADERRRKIRDYPRVSAATSYTDLKEPAADLRGHLYPPAVAAGAVSARIKNNKNPR
jgi:hypothetical protein